MDGRTDGIPRPRALSLPHAGKRNCLRDRLPATSLHFSRDECKTWSDAVKADDVGGAYPSLVTLKDGTALIVYYEEGEGSSIRARKFRLGEDGVTWLAW